MWAIAAVTARCAHPGNAAVVRGAFADPRQTIRMSSIVTHTSLKPKRSATGRALASTSTSSDQKKIPGSKTIPRSRDTSAPAARNDITATPSRKGKARDMGYVEVAGKAKGKSFRSRAVARSKSTTVHSSAAADSSDKHQAASRDQHAQPSTESDTIKGSSRTTSLEEEIPKQDELALAQEQLRKLFSSNLKVTANLHATSPSDKIAKTSDPISPSSHMGQDGETASSQWGISLPSPSFSRPTLAQLQSTELDQFSGMYTSKTAWDPRKDYTLMQDGPERESYLRRALEQGERQYIVLILDGDNLLFHPRHLNKGYEGGKFVYEELRQRIAKKHQIIPQRLDLRIRLFASIPALANSLLARRVVPRDMFFDFLQALTDASVHNYFVNVGKADQAADMRVKAALADAVQDPGCFRAYLGGLDDFGYKEELSAIHDMGLLDRKVHLVQVPGVAVESRAYQAYAHRAIDLDYLFKNNNAAMRDVDSYVSAHQDVMLGQIPWLRPLRKRHTLGPTRHYVESVRRLGKWVRLGLCLLIVVSSATVNVLTALTMTFRSLAVPWRA